MKRVSWIVLLVLVFALVLTACGGDEPEATAEAPTAPSATAVPAAVADEPTVAEEPAAEEPAAEEPVAEPEVAAETQVALADLNISSFDELNSYRYNMLIETTAIDETNTEVTQSVQMILAVTTDPPATSMMMKAEGQEGLEGMESMGDIEFVQLEDTNYIIMGEMGCMPLPADAEGAMSTDELTAGFTPESLMEDLENVTLVGEETINGIDTLHYTYDETSMVAEDMAGIESMEGHIYLAKEGGFMVRSIVDIVGISKYLADMATEGVQSGITHIEMNLEDVNGNVEIVIPESCVEQGSPDSVDWPMMDDASEVTSFAGILSYTTEASGSDTIDFYNEAMVGIGYTLDEASTFVAEGNGLLVYINANEESITITISEDTNTGLTTVTILSDIDIST